MRYQPVMIERSSLIGPAAMIIRMCTTKKPTSSSMTTGEMDGARRLPSAKHLVEERQHRIHAGRHGKPGDDHQRQQHEQHAAIGHLLQRVVFAGVVELQLGVVDDVLRQPLEVVEARRKIAPDMAVDQAGDETRRSRSWSGSRRRRNGRRGQCRDHSRRDGRPGREAARRLIACRTRPAEHAGRVETLAEDFGVAARAGARVLGADLEDRCCCNRSLTACRYRAGGGR